MSPDTIPSRMHSIYTIGGTPGSGKSTLAKSLATTLGYERIYAGGILRDWSKQQAHNPCNLPFDEWYRSLSSNPTFDNTVDRLVGEAAKTKNNLVLEGRVAFHFVPKEKLPHTERIYITCNMNEAARRIITHQQQNARPEETIYQSPHHAQKIMKERAQDERLRYQHLYHIDITNPKNYDLIIDSTNLTPVELFNHILL